MDLVVPALDRTRQSDGRCHEQVDYRADHNRMDAAICASLITRPLTPISLERGESSLRHASVRAEPRSHRARAQRFFFARMPSCQEVICVE